MAESKSRSRHIIEEVFKTYNRKQFLPTDPIQFAHRYSRKEDQEVIAFISALFSYGNVTQIFKAIEKIISPEQFQKNPADFLRNLTYSYWSGFYYRFHKEEHLESLLFLISTLLKKYGGLEKFFSKSYFENNNSFEEMLSQTTQECLKILEKRVRDLNQYEKQWRGLRFLFNDPKTGSSCKRLCMFLRWMIRKDEVDLGLWSFMPASDLVIPVDTHIARISYELGIRTSQKKTAPSWKMALEITKKLKEFDPVDPVRYDFAMTRVGILGIKI
ncbi:MAG: TIGR02757 family protein [Bacteriovoracia bacterium]